MIYKSISFSKQKKRNYLLKKLICKESKFRSVCDFAASSQNESAVLQGLKTLVYSFAAFFLKTLLFRDESQEI